MTNLIGKSLGRYHILEQLGEGGMAIVYKAYDTRLETDVAVKVIRTENILPSILERTLKRFEREAKSLARLTHPNIVKVTDYGEFEGKPYLVMPYLPGGTLKDRIKKGQIPWQEAVRLIIPIAQALEYAHEQGLIHRDIKPSNILLTSKGQPMLTDFGIAKLFDLEADTGLTETGMSVGTPDYMPPEQWQGQISIQTDMYALGVSLYEMITGRRPYMADTPAALLIKQTNDPLPRPTVFTPGLPDAVEKALLKLLAKRAEDRYQDMTSVVNALQFLITAPGRAMEETLSDAVLLANTPITMGQKEPPKANVNSQRKWILIGGSLAILLLLCGIFAIAGPMLMGNIFVTDTPVNTSSPNSISPTHSPTNQPTLPNPTQTFESLLTPTLPPSSMCNHATVLTDVTIPDGTVMKPGQTFEKVWRIKNTGSCAWTTSYSVVFANGEQMGGVNSYPIPSTVAPGQTIDISITLTAPTAPGSYRSNWMLRDASGILFGHGGTGPFWVDIKVIAQ